MPVGILGLFYLLYGIFSSFHLAPEIAALASWASGSGEDFHATFNTVIVPVLPPILGLVGLGLWLRSGIARSLALGVSYIGISAGMLTVLFSVVSPQAVHVILGRVERAEPVLTLPSTGVIVAVGVLTFIVAVAQYGILMANRTRQAFDFS